jgi:hypothetical protein
VQVNDDGAFKLALSADELRRHITLSPTKVGLLPPAQLSHEQQAALLQAFATKQAQT